MNRSKITKEMTIKTIIHIADIHIHAKNYARIEYAWKELIDRIIEHNHFPHELYLIIAGDVFEYKTKVTGKDIDVFHLMMQSLRDNQIKTFIMPGNHDFSDTSTNLIHSLLRASCDKDIMIVSSTTTTMIDNLMITTYSPLDKQIPLPSIRDNNDTKSYIAIVHEPIKKCQFDNGMIVENARLSVEDFISYDIVIMGDIHKPQFLTPTIAYCGSFVQKNRGEDVIHGYIEWNLEAIRGTFCPLTSYKNDVIISTLNNIPAILHPVVDPQSITYEYTNCAPEFIEATKNVITATYGRIDNHVNLTKHVQPIKDQSVTSKDYLSSALTNSTYTEEESLRILSVHNKYKSETRYSERRIWHLLSLQWENIYKYTYYSHIDFTKCRGVTILNGSNATGKTSIVNILIYILFGGRTGISGALNRELVLNNANNNDGQIKCSFAVGNDIYSIHRLIKRSGTDILSMTKNNEPMQTGDITATYEYMTTLIGNRDDFLSINVALQGRTMFSDLSAKDKMQFIERILGIDDLVSLTTFNRKVISDTKKIIKEISSLSPDNIKNLEEEIDKLSIDLKNVDNEIKLLKSQLKEDIYSSSINHSVMKDLKSEDYYIKAIKLAENAIAVLKTHKTHKLDANTKQILNDKKCSLGLLANNIIRLFNSKPELLKGPKIILQSEPSTQMIEECITAIGQIPSFDNELDIMNEAESIALSAIKVDPPLSYLMECHIDAFQAVNMTYDECEYKLSRLIYHSGILDALVLQNKLSKLPPPKYVDITILQQQHIESRAQLSVLNKIKSKDAPPLIGNWDLNDAYNVEQEITDIVKTIHTIDVKQVEELKSSIMLIDNQFGKVKFASSCPMCSINKNIIENIHSRSTLEKTLSDLETQNIHNIASVAKIAALNVRKNGIIAHLKQHCCNQIANLEHQIENAKQSNEAVILTEQLKKALENQASTLEAQKLNSMIKQHKENIAFINNQNYNHQNEIYLKYKTALNTLERIKYKRILEDNSSKLRSCAHYLANEIDNVSLELKMATDYDSILEHQKIIDESTIAINYIIANKDYNDNLTTNTMLNSQINLNEIKRDKLLRSIGEIQGRLIAANERDSRKKLHEETLFNANLYDTIMSEKSGIIGGIIKRRSEEIEEVWNRRLKSVVDWGVVIAFEKDKFTVNLYEGIRLISADVASGFQKFILDLTFRETLYQIAQVTIPSFMLIDEGFGTADELNRNSVKNYIKSLSDFQFVFVISHLDELQEVADCVVRIEVHNDGSHVAFGNLPALTRPKKDTTTDVAIIANQYIAHIELTDDLRYICKACNKILSNKGAAQKHCTTKAHLNNAVK